MPKSVFNGLLNSHGNNERAAPGVLNWTGGVDIGTSGTKSCFFGESPEYPFTPVEKIYLTSPYVRELTQSTYQDALDCPGEGGLDACLVSYVDPESGMRLFWELGQTAARPGFLPVESRKFESCVAKVLGLLGHLVRQELKTSDSINLNLGILIPFSEFEDRKRLGPLLRQVISDFELNGVAIRNIQFAGLDFKPEGYGLFRAYESERVLLVGHRDSTWLCFNSGKLSSTLSRTLPETGMHDFIRSIRFPIVNELQAAKALSLAGHKLKPKPLIELTQTRSTAELEQLQQAIRQALSQYWVDRRSQFKLLNLGECQSVPVAGGTAHYFCSELTQLFAKAFKVQLYWCEDLRDEFRQRFHLGEGSEKLEYRFSDIYAYTIKLPGVRRYDCRSIEEKGASVNV